MPATCPWAGRRALLQRLHHAVVVVVEYRLCKATQAEPRSPTLPNKVAAAEPALDRLRAKVVSFGGEFVECLILIRILSLQVPK